MVEAIRLGDEHELVGLEASLTFEFATGGLLADPQESAEIGLGVVVVSQHGADVSGPVQLSSGRGHEAMILCGSHTMPYSSAHHTCY